MDKSTKLSQVYYNTFHKTFCIFDNKSGWIEIPSPVNDQVTKNQRPRIVINTRTESVVYEDLYICIEAVRDSTNKRFEFLELLDKRNGGFHTNKPEFWDNLSFILTLDQDGSDAQKIFSEEFGEENLDTIASFVSQLKEEDWFHE